MADEARDDTDKPKGDGLSTPYGPQYGRIDDAAGGADSSPFDNMSSDERQAAADEAKRQNKGSGDTLNN